MGTVSNSSNGDGGSHNSGEITVAEIYHQPLLWHDTFERSGKQNWGKWAKGSGVLCGAGTSAYAAGAIQAAWPASRAIATTDLLTDSRALKYADFLLSIGRSGDSPESVAVVDMASRDFPDLPQLAITCNSQGQLAQRTKLNRLLLDPRTNDRSLVMTSSFSNLVLAGLSLSHQEVLKNQLSAICTRAERQLPRLDTQARDVARTAPSRVVVLASAPLFPWAQEASLKILEMTAGRIAALPETYLGLRHGPMSFLDRNTLVLCLTSSHPRTRLYESDLTNELYAKQLGRVVAIAPVDFSCKGIDTEIEAVAPELTDCLRTGFEIIFPQLLAYHLSLGLGLNPDNPSPNGIINRVVNGVNLH
jgi:tagatose-6-phosphate ketose/aldose isomerase